MRTEDLVAELNSQVGPPPDVDAAWETLLTNDRRLTRRKRALGTGVAVTLIVVVVAAIAQWPSSDSAHTARVASPSPSTTQATPDPGVVVPEGWKQVSAPTGRVALAIPDDWREFASLPTTSTSVTPLITVGRANADLGNWLNTACSVEPGNDTPSEAGIWLTLYEYPSAMATERLTDPVYGDTLTSDGEPFGQVAVPRPADFTTTNDASPGTTGCSPNGYTFKDQFFTDAGRVFVARAVVTGGVVDKYAQMTPREILNTLHITGS
jgi:hypothetical protein